MSPPLVHLKEIAHGFGGKRVLDGAELAVGTGDRLCLVGRNGSGKSTLLKIAAGIVEPERGERFVHPSATIRYLEQEPDLTRWPTVHAYVESGLNEGDDPHRARALLPASQRAWRGLLAQRGLSFWLSSWGFLVDKRGNQFTPFFGRRWQSAR